MAFATISVACIIQFPNARSAGAGSASITTIIKIANTITNTSNPTVSFPFVKLPDIHQDGLQAAVKTYRY